MTHREIEDTLNDIARETVRTLSGYLGTLAAAFIAAAFIIAL